MCWACSIPDVLSSTQPLRALGPWERQMQTNRRMRVSREKCGNVEWGGETQVTNVWEVRGQAECSRNTRLSLAVPEAQLKVLVALDMHISWCTPPTGLRCRLPLPSSYVCACMSMYVCMHMHVFMPVCVCCTCMAVNPHAHVLISLEKAWEEVTCCFCTWQTCLWKSPEKEK